MAWAIVILGAAVWPGGEPSPSLARRIACGHLAAGEGPGDLIFCSGGLGHHGPSEASVMAQALIGGGVDPQRIALDEDSRDTLQNVTAAARFIRTEGLEGAVVCTDGYHVPRTRMLFGVLGIASRVGPIRPGYAGSRTHWLRMVAREALAYPYDLGLAVVGRRALLAAIAPDRDLN